MHVFEGILFFKATNKTKQTDNLAAASWVLQQERVHETDLLVFRIVCAFEEENSLENLHSALFCLIKRRSVPPSVLLIVVLRTLAINSVSASFGGGHECCRRARRIRRLWSSPGICCFGTLAMLTETLQVLLVSPFVQAIDFTGRVHAFFLHY